MTSMPLLNQREAADFLRLSQRTLERFRLTGDGPPYVKAGRRVAYRREDLDRWIADRVRTSTSGRAA
jgi:predicted DNA-binding transcriptional regulator AlpA